MKSFNQKLIEQDILLNLNSEEDFNKVCADCILILESADFVNKWESFNKRNLFDMNQEKFNWENIHNILYPIAKQLYDEIHLKANKDTLYNERDCNEKEK